MKHIFLCIFLLICTFLPFFITAQSISLTDLESDIYRDLERWEAGAYLASLPKIQPYAHGIVTERLREMLARNDLPETARKQARDYLDRLIGSETKETFRKGPAISFTALPTARFTEEGTHTNLIIRPGVHWLLSDSDSARLWLETLPQISLLLDSQNSTALPAGERETEDWFAVGDASIPLFDSLLYPVGFLDSIVSFSSSDERSSFSFSVGIHRANAGPFYDDGILISSQAPAAGHFILGYEHFLGSNNNFTSRILFSSQFSALVASDDEGRGVYSEKFLAYHSIYADLLPWFGFGFIETIIWGGRIEPLYLIPLPGILQFSQGISGYGDNGLLGIELLFRPVESLRIPLVIFIDDIGADDIYRFEFDTKYKFAAEGGVSWSPLLPWLDQITADYTAVMPYMYTHWDERPQMFGSGNERGGEANYSNYTHKGTNIGPGLEPNSDRWRLNWSARPFAGELPDWFHTLRLGAGIQLIRHGNASEGIIQGSAGDLFDPGYIGSTPTFQAPYEDPTGQPYTRFLTQNLIEHNLQFNIDIHAAFLISPDFRIDLGIGYTHEEVWNAELVEDARKSANYLNILLGLSI